MRVGMIPENPLEWLAARANALPFPVADTFVAIIQAKAIMAATRLSVFAALAPASELAAKLSCTEKGIQILQSALVGYGYAVKTKGRHDLAPCARVGHARRPAIHEHAKTTTISPCPRGLS